MGRHHSDEWKAKMRERNLGSKNPNYGKGLCGVLNPMYGKHHSEETKTKIRAKNLGKQRNLEARANIKKANTSRPNPMLGKHHSDAVKAKISTGLLAGHEPKPATGRNRARKLFICPKGLEIHHKDGNPLNNSPENIVFVTRKEHVRLDGRLIKATKSRVAM